MSFGPPLRGFGDAQAIVKMTTSPARMLCSTGIRTVKSKNNEWRIGKLEVNSETGKLEAW